MIRVHVLTKLTTASSSFNFPLMWHKRRLEESGVDIRMFTTSSPDLPACQALFLNAKVFGDTWRGLAPDVESTIGRARARGVRVLWFDTSASTGTTQFEVLPLVDGYYKAVALADRTGYLKRFHGDRIFTDWYRALMQRDASGGAPAGDAGAGADGATADDPRRSEGPAAAAEAAGAARGEAALPAASDLHKIGVSWSTALGDHGRRARLYRRIRKYAPFFKRYSARFTPPAPSRERTVACRLGLHHEIPEVLWHRQRIREVLERDFGVDTRPIPREAYLEELAAARVGVSPFGYGEVCLRDYEVMLAGAALVKPDMDHLETWPPLYAKDETYAAHRWDLQDLGETLEALLPADRWMRIASGAQRLYRRYLFEAAGRAEFCERVASLIRRHL